MATHLPVLAGRAHPTAAVGVCLSVVQVVVAAAWIVALVADASGRGAVSVFDAGLSNCARAATAATIDVGFVARYLVVGAKLSGNRAVVGG